MPRGCGTSGACQVGFNLNASQIGLVELGQWVSPSPKVRPWYRVLESRGQVGSPFLTSLRASGRLTAERLKVQRLTATRVSAKVDLDSGKLRVSELTAEFLGGKHHGQWQADFSDKPSICDGSGSLNGISLTGLADAMNDGWIAGTASGTYTVKGTCSAEFWTSAEGTLQFDMSEGRLPHVALSEDADPFKVTGFTGQARLHAGEIEMKDAQLDSPDGKFQLSGTASLQGELDFRLARPPNGGARSGYTITGTLEEPRVNPASGGETQARLKP
jgi:autotransporter translocation and assembly factor TamB